MDIRCRKTICKYNDRYTCRAKDILVDNKVICSTYEKGEERTKTLDEIGDIPNKIHTFTSESKNKLEYENYSSDGKLEAAGCSQDGFPLLAASAG